MGDVVAAEALVSRIDKGERTRMNSAQQEIQKQLTRIENCWTNPQVPREEVMICNTFAHTVRKNAAVARQ